MSRHRRPQLKMTGTSLVSHIFGYESIDDHGAKMQSKGITFYLRIHRQPSYSCWGLPQNHRCGPHGARWKVRRSQKVIRVRPRFILSAVVEIFQSVRPTERVNSRLIKKAFTSCLFFVAFIKYKVQVPSLWEKKEGWVNNSTKIMGYFAIIVTQHTD